VPTEAGSPRRIHVRLKEGRLRFCSLQPASLRLSAVSSQEPVIRLRSRLPSAIDQPNLDKRLTSRLMGQPLAALRRLNLQRPTWITRQHSLRSPTRIRWRSWAPTSTAATIRSSSTTCGSQQRHRMFETSDSASICNLQTGAKAGGEITARELGKYCAAWRPS
jgi:hypothetical protein